MMRLLSRTLASMILVAISSTSFASNPGEAVAVIQQALIQSDGTRSVLEKGAPVLSGGGGSPAAFVGPTAGYLASFPIVAALAGLLPRARTPVGHAMGFAGFLGLHVVILAMGWAWLSRLIGAEAAFASGVVPFLIGSVVKAGLASAILAALPAAWRRA